MRTVIGLLLLVWCSTQGGDLKTNCLAIYAITNRFDGESILSGEKPIDKGLRSESLLFSDLDFVDFDPTNHLFSITPAAATRLLNAPWVRVYSKELTSLIETNYYWDAGGSVVIFAAFNKPIYAGAFPKLGSSQVPAWPVVSSWPSKFALGISHKAVFKIEPAFSDDPNAVDVRNDPRIRSAAQALFSRGKAPSN